MDYSLGLYASRDYAERNGLPANPSELSASQFVGYVGGRRQPFARPRRRVQSDWTARFAISSAMGQVEAVRSGAGIEYCILSSPAPARTGAGDVRPQIRRAYWMVYRESVRPLRRVQVVAGFIARLVEKERALLSGAAPSGCRCYKMSASHGADGRWALILALYCLINPSVHPTSVSIASAALLRAAAKPTRISIWNTGFWGGPASRFRP